MNWLRHALILLAILFSFALFGHFLPKLIQIDPAKLSLLPEVKPIVDSTKLLSFREQLMRSLPVQKEVPKKGNRIAVWTVGKGKALPVYLLVAQDKIQSMGGSVLRMEELNGKQQAARLSWSDSLGDSSLVEIRIGDDFLVGSSTLAFVFAVDSSIPPPVIATLNSLSIPYSLLVQPFDTSSALAFDLDKLVNKDIVAWLGMEPKQYPWVNPGPRSILIHHNEKQITSIIDDAIRNLPNAIGLASRMGERAVEHRPLLEALVRSAGEKHLWFLDLTSNRSSKTTDVCTELGVSCQKSFILPEDKDPASYLQKSLETAVKAGSSTIILHLTEDNVEAVRALIPLAQAQGTEIVKLTRLMNQSQ